mmetsp:Transcript_62238/g.100674  ORF Transcript_62238/g.100674 Transcript_62238/m.100674 type:complete len:92 (-) Transcript_62238:458-733(-)
MKDPRVETEYSCTVIIFVPFVQFYLLYFTLSTTCHGTNEMRISMGAFWRRALGLGFARIEVRLFALKNTQKFGGRAFGEAQFRSRYWVLEC